MKQTWLALALAPVFVADAHAGTRLEFKDCALRSDYGLRWTEGEPQLLRPGERPQEIRLRNGRLWLDGDEQTLSPPDRQRIQQIEAELTRMLPEIMAIAEQGLDMAITALAHLAGSLGDNDPALLTQIESARAELSAAIGERMRGGSFDEARLDAEIAALAERLTPQIAGKVAALAISAALSGDEAAASEFSRRAEAMGKELETALEARGKALEARASRLCAQLERIDLIENALELRLPDGSALDLLQLTPATR